jgi:hypothetical protein
MPTPIPHCSYKLNVHTNTTGCAVMLSEDCFDWVMARIELQRVQRGGGDY